MQSEHSITIVELFTMAVHIGFPVYFAGAAVQVALIYLLRLDQGRNSLLVILCVGTTFLSSLLFATLIWLFVPLPGENIFMLFGVANFPAIIAEMIMIPIFLKISEYMFVKSTKV